ncbi:MAG: hypothetical protein IPJ65_14200 [Archangiaceae bacterium]|nr:hypothetical protein [Archangiaceae bacterium]
MSDVLFETAAAAYERGRARWALLSALPLAVIPLGSYAVGHRLAPSVGLGLALLGLGAALLWRGKGLGRGLAVGVKAGLVPLVLAHGANLYGHLCTANGCTSLCVPACLLGGAVAGFIIAVSAARAAERWHVSGSAAVTASVIGAFGCSCVGAGGIAGLVLGIAASLSAARLWARAAA